MTNPSRFSRRDFLKLSGSSLLGGLLLSTPGLSSVLAAESTSPARLGRVAHNKVNVYDVPSRAGNKVKTCKFNDLIEIGGQVWGSEEADYNRSWYKLRDGGYVYSGGIQPVMNILNTPVTEIPKDGALAEITVPFTDTRWKPTELSRRGYRLYYSTTYWVKAVFEDEKKNLWYRIYDDLFELVFFIHAEHMRIIPAAELAPISPAVPEDSKTILVSLPEQMMAAYEDNRPVFTARISSGTGKGERHYASTPTGAFTTFFKRPAGHMSGGDGVSSYYDLPGVPWTSYINNNGVSFHGTYWHNDYGAPHSHGCINLPPEKAKWIYRWTMPAVPVGKRHIYVPGTGTRVYISDLPLFSAATAKNVAAKE